MLVTVAIPTLHAGEPLTACLAALRRQTFRDFEIVVIDNSTRHLTGQIPHIRTLEMPVNVGFGVAINAAFEASVTPYLVTLNDDALPHPDWLAALVHAIEDNPDAGSCASHVTLVPEAILDSAGMLLCADGSSKQRGHGDAPEIHNAPVDVLLPSASAALYRRAMLEEIGLFDSDFFLYCEDTDLGLRAARAGWRCLFVPGARVDHLYSHSAGRTSALKAYYVERNRIRVALKNFPLPMLLAAPFVSLQRYLWHLYYMWQGKGAAAKFEEGTGGAQLIWFVLKAHLAALKDLAELLRKRKTVQARTNAHFAALLKKHSISPRRIAAL